jgi:hypothetical protein
MACVVSGGASGQIKLGQHIATASEHPARVLISLMNAVGVPTSALGDVTGPLPGLLV